MCVQDGTADLSYFSRLSFICKKKKKSYKDLNVCFLHSEVVGPLVHCA